MSLFAFAGAAQFAAVGYVREGLPWLGIIVLTFFLNARHLLYAAALAPLDSRPRPTAERAAPPTSSPTSPSHSRRPTSAGSSGSTCGATAGRHRRDVHPVEPRHARGLRARWPRGRPGDVRPGLVFPVAMLGPGGGARSPDGGS